MAIDLSHKETISSYKVIIDVVARASIFLINITIPYIVWLHIFSTIQFNRQDRKDRRLCIGNARAVIYRKRKNIYVTTSILCLIVACFSISRFGKTNLEEGIFLFLMLFVTFVIPLIQLYFFRSQNIRSILGKNFQNYPIYKKDYLNTVNYEYIIGNQKNTHYINVESDDSLDLGTISTIHKLCNGQIFIENNLNKFYNVMNLKVKEKFDVNQKIRFLSLVWLVQTAIDNKEWDKKILEIFGIDYKEEYQKNRKKHIDEDTLKSLDKSLSDKIEYILDTKV